MNVVVETQKEMTIAMTELIQSNKRLIETNNELVQINHQLTNSTINMNNQIVNETPKVVETTAKDCNKIGYIYLLQEREFVHSNTPIYKIGKSKQANVSRFRQYPKGSILLFQKVSNDCDSHEKTLKNIFAEKYIQHPEIGCEYFEGNSNDMANDIFSIV